jgi:hypothetical protein
MFGYEGKALDLSHASALPVTFSVEVDFGADNTWHSYGQFTVLPGQTLRHVFPDGYSAHWVRLRSDTTTTATAQFTYGPAAPEITGVSAQADGSVQLAFTGGAGQPFTLRASDDLTQPIGSWTPLTNGTFTPGPVLHHDQTATSFSRRFYLISIP